MEIHQLFSQINSNHIDSNRNYRKNIEIRKNTNKKVTEIMRETHLNRIPIQCNVVDGP